MQNEEVIVKAKEMCQICLTELEDAEAMCSNSHFYCGECLNMYYEGLIMDKKLITNECTVPGCKKKFFENKLNALLSEEVMYLLFKNNIFEEFQIPENLYVMSCPVCPDRKKVGIFLVQKDDYLQFYSCDMDKCGKTVCLYCLCECTNKADHVLCKKFFKTCLDLEKASFVAMNPQCPHCKQKKIEIDYEPPSTKAGCTHITCQRCNSYYCYVCQGHSDEVDKAEGTKIPIYRHNDDWKTNKKRCPWYLNYFNEVIDTWSNNEDISTNDFNDYKLKAYINKVILKYTLPIIKSAYECFKTKRLIKIPREYIYEVNYNPFANKSIIDDKIFQFFKLD